ncbi:hypothetical protein [Chryseobacterium phocaeense]|uniref:hypothetical protein n=1 Tax=Chryseobacterium phocaeense TaxID=1816690 RepID=UPI0009B98521|nr:hypothetical protein [Chryseobacterium phocaeense]
MKKIFIVIILNSSFLDVKSQVVINGASSTNASISTPSVLLEFSNNANKGLILPWTNGDVPNPVNGTIIFNNVERKIKAFVNNQWVDYSNEAGTNNGIDNSLQNNPLYPEKPDAKVIIGNPTNVKGILVLESANKAMVLPKLASPHLNIIKPAPGMIAFDTVKELLCIFNGTQWSFIQKNEL